MHDVLSALKCAA